MSLLPAVAAGFENGHAFDANLVESVLYRIEFCDLNDCFDFRHDSSVLVESDRILATRDVQTTPGRFPVISFFAMLRKIKPLDFLLLRNPQPDRHIHHFQDHQGSHPGQHPGNHDSHELVEQLVRVAFQQS